MPASDAAVGAASPAGGPFSERAAGGAADEGE